jgi:repressor LexA
MFGDILKRIREEHNLSQKALSEKINVSQQTVGSWETNRTSPSPEMIKSIAEYFEISTDVLIGNIVKSKKPLVKREVLRIPVYGRVAAGVPIQAVEDIIDYEEAWKDEFSDGEYIALQIKGNSMEPKFSTGDVVLVRLQPDVDSGQIAVVIINGDEATVKRLIKHSNGIALVSTNPEYEPMYFSNKQIEDLPVTVLGRVVELRAKF